MMSRIALLGILVMAHAGAGSAAAQVFTTPKGEAENVKFEQVGGGTVHILYDLVASDPRAVFLVTLDASQDRGATYTVKPLSVTGDVGQGITAGTGKRIVWESGRDVERLEIDQFRFRISAQAGPLELKPDPAAAPAPAPAPPAAAATPEPAPAPPASPVKPTTAAQTATAKPSGGGGGGTKWLLIGGGVAAAGGVAIAAGGGGGGGTTSNPPTSNTPPVAANQAPVITGRSHSLQETGSTASAVVGVTNVLFQVTATDPDANSQLTAVFTFGDGSTSQSIPLGANGTASTAKTYTALGPQRASVVVSDGRGASASADYVQFTTMNVSGIYTAPGAANLRLELVQNGAAVSGAFADATRAGSLAGQLESPRKIETLTITYRTPTPGTEVFAALWGPDLRTLTIMSRSGTTVTLARQQ
jgi:hypothetical protein